MASSTSKSNDSGSDDIKENTPEENAKVVAQATGKGSSEKQDEVKEKAPATSEVAGAWIRTQLEEGPKTKAELIELAAKANPAKFEKPRARTRRRSRAPRSGSSSTGRSRRDVPRQRLRLLHPGGSRLTQGRP